MADPSNAQSTTTTSKSIADLATRFMKWAGPDPERPVPMVQARQRWDRWELDGRFFQTLSQWTLENPETTLDRVLDNIRDGLENSKDLLALIPESPFPARGMVTALAYLLKLGVSIRRAQRDVQEFSRDFVQWVGNVKSAFESAEKGDFTLWAWRDIRHMRELVDKMCSWAVDRLHDGRWLRIGHGLTIQKEILEFKERISNARALFQDLSAINTARGLDAIMQKLRDLVLNQRVIIKEIQQIGKTQKRQLDRIMNELELQKQIAERERFFVNTLNVHAIANATYDSQGKRPCDEDTRIEVLQEIREWKNNITRVSTNFLWLTGDPGCGKSAVTASFARECKNEGVLWAQFFINRNNIETTNPRSFFPTIARQLADYSPDVAQAIHHTLVRQRSLTDDISAEQAAHLFAHSICKASELDSDRPVVVVIDGLDETDRKELKRTAAIFSTLFTALESHSNVKVFISSRTEDDIQKSFVLPRNDRHVKRIHLDTADPSSARDVSHFVTRNLLNLVKEHDLNWDVWPGDKRSRMLGERASGLFIWAVTAIKFIQEQLEAHGTEHLNGVLDSLTAERLHDINVLYTLILTVTLGKGQDGKNAWELERFRRIIGAVVCLQEPLCLDDLAALLDIRQTPSSDLVDIIHFVRRFRTILVTGTDTINGSTIPRIHKSVYEFLTSDTVATHFRVDPTHAHLELVLQCLAYLGTEIQSIHDPVLSVPFRYACRFWFSHFSQTNIFGPTPLRANFRASSRSPSAPLIFRYNKPYLIQYSAPTSRIKLHPPHALHIRNATTGDSLSHTDGIIGMVLSPDGKDIVSWSWDNTVRVWDSTNTEQKRTLVRYSSFCKVFAISPDGKLFFSAFDDGVLCLGEYTLGTHVWKTSYEQERFAITCAAFSHTGNRIISGFDGGVCRLLDVLTGEVVGKPWTGRKGDSIDAVAFSTNDKRACSVTANGHCFIWDVSTGQQIVTWQHSELFSPISISFLPSSLNTIVVTAQNGITIQSYDHRWSIPHCQYTRQFLFSPDGQEIIYDDSHGISVAKICNEERATRIMRRITVTFPGSLSAFSPNWDFAYTTQSNVIHAHGLQHSATSLKLVAVDEEPLITYKGGYDQLFDALLLPDQIEHHCYAVTNNQRLDNVKWYKLFDVAQFGVNICITIGNLTIAGYDDGSVALWGMAHKSSPTQQPAKQKKK